MTFHAKAHNMPFYQKLKCCGINASCKFYILGEYTENGPAKHHSVFNRNATEQQYDRIAIPFPH